MGQRYDDAARFVQVSSGNSLRWLYVEPADDEIQGGCSQGTGNAHCQLWGVHRLCERGLPQGAPTFSGIEAFFGRGI